MADMDFNRDVKFFQSISWARILLDDPAYLTIPTPSRIYKKSTEDAVIAETLNTKDTIKAWLTMYKKPAVGDTLITESRTLLSLGHGVNGYPGLVHGGIMGLVIDEAMGIMLQLNAYAAKMDSTTLVVTAYLKTTFLRPAPTPSIILLTTKLREHKERKMYVDATIENEAGDVLATGEALFIRAKEPQPKL